MNIQFDARGFGPTLYKLDSTGRFPVVIDYHPQGGTD